MGTAAAKLRSGRTEAHRAESAASGAQLSNGAPASLRRAGADFGAAAHRLGDPDLAPLRLLPVVGRQLHSAHALAQAGATASLEVTVALDHAASALHGHEEGGTGRLTKLRQLMGVASALDNKLAAIRLGPDRALVGPLASARAEVSSRLTRSLKQLAQAHAAMEASLAILEGDHRVLLLAANNAEMRAGVGMALEAGDLIAHDGTLALDKMQSVNGLRPEAPIPISGPFFDRWGSFAPSQDFRELFLAPRFDVTAPVAARMWTAVGGGEVIAVMAIDPVFLRAVLTATGPVTVQGQSYDAENILSVLLHDQYVGVAATDDAQAAREQRLGQVARAAFDKLSGGGVPLGTLAQALSQVAVGRHVMVWSADPKEEQNWQAAGVAGSLGPDSLLVSVLNRGANKLDYFLTVRAGVHLTKVPNHTQVSVVVHLENRTPPGEPQFVAGPNPDYPIPGSAAGEYRGIVQVEVPGRATDVAIGGVPTPEINGPDGPAWVIATPVFLPPNGSRDFTVTFLLDGDSGTLTLEPAGRIPLLEWSLNGSAQPGDTPHHVRWSAGP